MDKDYEFVLAAYENEDKYDKALKLAIESDIVMMGTTSDVYIKERLKQDKLTFRYRERIFQSGIKTLFNKEKMKNIYERHIKYRKNKNLYMLCASAYGANDFYKLGLYKDKIYKWGYFPKTEYYDVENLIQKKEENKKIKILWAGRFKKWKHPEYMIKLARKLKKQNYEFEINLLGNGEMYPKIEKKIKSLGLEKDVKLLGAIDSDKVREYMKDANIYAFTSNRNEGWGAVLNEAMNSACAVVANKYIGAAPFLIKQDENGMMYKTFKEFYAQIEELIKNKEKRIKISKNAYRAIEEQWNSKKATENLVELFECIKKGQEIRTKKGPASKAIPTK